jgi:hypothetical protein
MSNPPKTGLKPIVIFQQINNTRYNDYCQEVYWAPAKPLKELGESAALSRLASVGLILTGIIGLKFIAN